MCSLRITGMATGMDTDATIKQMMKPYTMKVDKMKQNRQVVAWRQELYRDILSDTASIRKTYFDILKSDTYMLSKNNYAGFDVTTTNSEVGKSAGASATASAGAVAGSYSVKVEKLATAAKVDGKAINEVNISEISISSPITIDSSNNTIKLKIGNGIYESVELTSKDYTTKTDLINEINDQIKKITALSGQIEVTSTDTGLKFNALTNESVKIGSDTTVALLADLKDKVINPNRYSTKLSDLGIVDGGTLNFEYKDSNGLTQNKAIVVSKDSTISQLIDKVNQSTSGAIKLNFSELTDEFSIESLQTGSSALFKVTEGLGSDVLKKLNLKLNGTVTVEPGINAKAIITPPGVGAVATTVEKSGNSFSIDGINYTLTTEGTTNNITVVGNSQKTYDKIKGFIDKYNELVEKVSKKTDEKKQYKYLPLSDEEKKAMSEDEVKQWESKAKEGLLKGDANLESMLNEMRSAFFQGVENAGISLSEIGLSTSPDTSQRGKIIIDEKKLKTAIETRGEQVANLFMKQSTTHSTYSVDHTNEQRSVRRKEEGIFQRINDILQDYTTTSINVNGKKGILLEKAGIKGDRTEFKSLLSEDIKKKDEKINEMIRNLAVRENKYYLQFSKLETAMNKMNSQSSWLAQQLGGGQ